MKFMTENDARQAIVSAGKRISDRGYVASNDGNISVKMGVRRPPWTAYVA